MIRYGMDGEHLLINDNNTRTKFALATRSELLAHCSLFSAEVSEDAVGELLGEWDWKSSVLASVVPSHLPDLRAALSARDLVEVSHRIPLGVEVDFPDPSSVGADRLANAAAIAGEFPNEAVVVVDFGTAVTFDIIDSRPAYIGGVIAPGLDAMRHYLHKRTALLPEIDLVRPDSAIGKTTEHAMQSGAFHGYRGLVREILGQIGREMEGPAKVIATGGYAALIADGLPEIDVVDERLTMKGLLKLANLNFSS
jgi:type III pantothenate kinase